VKVKAQVIRLEGYLKARFVAIYFCEAHAL